MFFLWAVETHAQLSWEWKKSFTTLGPEVHTEIGLASQNMEVWTK